MQDRIDMNQGMCYSRQSPDWEKLSPGDVMEVKYPNNKNMVVQFLSVVLTVRYAWEENRKFVDHVTCKIIYYLSDDITADDSYVPENDPWYIYHTSGCHVKIVQ
jgi:hypothetical protein